MKKKLLIPIIALLAPVLVAGGAVLAVGPERAMAIVGLGGDPAENEQQQAKDNSTDHADESDGGQDGEGGPDAPQITQSDMPLMPFPEMIVNVTDTTADGRQTSRFLKVNLLMVFDETAPGAAQLTARELYIRDAFQSFLRSLNVADLQGARGIALLKSELLRRARAVGHTDAPRDILISDLVIQ
ncbi:flagellar FliL protein [Palleronia salina]|uniref:Flagellar protein FliL n=1 Tax=Palleronia salina TaxID=313368 RepID=A0A1M6CY76_9RHOB|nr:flagellar FliL protein [Palleronia salina]